MTNQEIYHDFKSKYDVKTSDYRPLSKIFVENRPGITIWTDKGDLILYFPKQAERRLQNDCNT